MDRAQWGRFTDFGVTLLDSVGRQLGKKPLNYAFGRLQVEAPPGHGDMPVDARHCFPGFADPADTAAVDPARLHSALRRHLRRARIDRRQAKHGHHRAAGKSATAAFTLPADPWPLGDKFVPLGLLVARADGRSWTREVDAARRRRRRVRR